jgi:hypothetical protein
VSVSLPARREHRTVGLIDHNKQAPLLVVSPPRRGLGFLIVCVSRLASRSVSANVSPPFRRMNFPE